MMATPPVTTAKKNPATPPTTQSSTTDASMNRMPVTPALRRPRPRAS
jgi:hypothetical protein